MMAPPAAETALDRSSRRLRLPNNAHIAAPVSEVAASGDDNNASGCDDSATAAEDPDDALPDLDDDDEFEAYVMRVAAAECVAVFARHKELTNAIAWLEQSAAEVDRSSADGSGPGGAIVTRALGTALRLECAFAKEVRLSQGRRAVPALNEQ